MGKRNNCQFITSSETHTNNSDGDLGDNENSAGISV